MIFKSLERKIKAIDATSNAVVKPQENGQLDHFKEPLPNTNQHTSQGILLYKDIFTIYFGKFIKLFGNIVFSKRCQSNVESR